MRPWEQFTNQQQWKEYLQHLLRTNDKALYRAIILIAEYQTPHEVVLEATIEHNNVGFGAVDAEMMTALAFRLKNGGTLTEREKAISRNKMPKYWRQLMNISKRRMQDERKETSKVHMEGVESPDGQLPSTGIHDGGGHPDSPEGTPEQVLRGTTPVTGDSGLPAAENQPGA